MESNTLPTVERYQNDYAKRFGYVNWTELCTFESKATIIQETRKMTKEYAILFAKHHRKEMIEAIFNNATLEVISNGKTYPKQIADSEKVIKIHYKSIENAYKESEIK